MDIIKEYRQRDYPVKGYLIVASIDYLTENEKKQLWKEILKEQDVLTLLKLIEYKGDMPPYSNLLSQVIKRIHEAPAGNDLAKDWFRILQTENKHLPMILLLRALNENGLNLHGLYSYFYQIADVSQVFHKYETNLIKGLWSNGNYSFLYDYMRTRRLLPEYTDHIGIEKQDIRQIFNSKHDFGLAKFILYDIKSDQECQYWEKQLECSEEMPPLVTFCFMLKRFLVTHTFNMTEIERKLLEIGIDRALLLQNRNFVGSLMIGVIHNALSDDSSGKTLIKFLNLIEKNNVFTLSADNANKDIKYRSMNEKMLKMVQCLSIPEEDKCYIMNNTHLKVFLYKG